MVRAVLSEDGPSRGSVVLSNHRLKRRALRKAGLLRQSLAAALNGGAGRDGWGAYAEDVYDLNRPVPRAERRPASRPAQSAVSMTPCPSV